MSSSVTGALSSSLPIGINPFWKLSFVFKCLTDCVVLDDFKTALDRLRAFKVNRLGSFAAENGGSLPLEATTNGIAGSQEAKKMEMRSSSPDGDDLAKPRVLSNESSDITDVEPSKPKDRTSQITESSGEVEVSRHATDSPVIQPQSSWFRNSTEDDYAQACREVTRSSQSESRNTERETGSNRGR